MGGKKALRKRIATYIPADINFYIEVFGGAAWVMFYKDKWANQEVYNDLDHRLVNLFTQIKWHPEAVMEELEFMLNSRQLFGDILDNKGITEIQKAARFMYLLKNSFGGMGKHFGTSRKSGGAALGRRSALLEKIHAISERLDKVLIENQSYEQLIPMYDTEDNFFYCDPPYYHGATYDNSKAFDHGNLRDMLTSIKGRFLLSYDNAPEVKELYKGFDVIELVRPKGINRKEGRSDYEEVLIANYELCQRKDTQLNLFGY
jgi:DNA adenine methylase